MTSGARFRVTVHISHPSHSAAELASELNLKQRYARSVGAPRVGKAGTPLGGVYERTDLSLEVTDVVSSNEVSLPEVIASAIERLPSTLINRITRSGGTVFFLVGVYSEGNILVDFPVTLISQLAKHAIGLKLDFYGGPDTSAAT